MLIPLLKDNSWNCFRSKHRSVEVNLCKMEASLKDFINSYHNVLGELLFKVDTIHKT